MAGGEVSVAQGEFAAAMDAEPAAAAELLIDAKARARGMGDVGGGAFDLIGRGAQFDQAGGADLSQRECARELRTLLRFELGRHAEQSPGTNLARMVEAVLRLDVIGGPSVQECTSIPEGNSPRIADGALAGVAAGDIGELALECWLDFAMVCKSEFCLGRPVNMKFF